MNNIFILYIIGVCVVGIIKSILFKIDSYWDWFCSQIDDAKHEIIKEIGDNPLLDSIEYVNIANLEIISISLLSWIGLIITIFNFIAYICRNIKI